ncbi:MAG TPA: hypothetical protein VM165_07510 [Planctomycetaceae bacterium]|nr:hypothetical protein [Planctomycetaceae bacterium]
MGTAIQTGLVTLKSPASSEVQPRETQTFAQVTFPTPFPVGAKVVVVPFVQTFNGPDTPGLRLADVTHTGFMIRMNELVGNGGKSVLSNGLHCAEEVGWIAFIV